MFRMVSYFLCSYVVFRGLHSFPTRRSSDLCAQRRWHPGQPMDFDHRHSLPGLASRRSIQPVYRDSEQQEHKSTRLNSRQISTSYADLCEQKLCVETPAGLLASALE